MPSDNLMPQSSTSVIKHFMLRSSTTGQGLTGKVHSDFSGKYNIAGGAEVTLSFSSGSAGDAYSSGKIVPLGLGKYAWHVPNAVFASLGNVSAVLSCSGGIDVHCEWLVVADNRDLATKPVNVTQFGGTNLTAAAGIPEVRVASIATDAVNASALAANAVSEIQSGLATITNVADAQSSIIAQIDANETKLDSIQSDTNDIQARLPAALVGGKMNSIAELDSAVRVKLDASQPDYAPLLASGYTAPANADITAIKAKTDNLPSDPADQSLVIAATDAVMARLGTPAGASLSADLAAVKSETGTTLPNQIAALNNLSSAQVVSALGTGTWATAIPWNAAWDAEVQSEVQDAIEVNNLDHLLKVAVDTNFATTVHLNSVIGNMADNGTTATFSRTTDSLEAIRDNQTASSGASLPDIIAGVQSVSGAIIEAQNSATLSIRIGDTWTQDIESLGDLTDKTVCFALKKRASDADTAAIVFIVEGTGLTRLNGATTTAGWGSITILDEAAGDIRLRLESNATALLTSGSYVDAVKVLEDGDDRSPRNAGRTVVSAGVIADIT